MNKALGLAPKRSAAGLPPKLKLELARFACAVAWLDGGPQPDEKRLIHGLAERLELAPKDMLKVTRWLVRRPMRAPTRLDGLPRAQRRLFVEVARAVTYADYHPGSAEEQALSWLKRQLLELERKEKVHGKRKRA